MSGAVTTCAVLVAIATAATAQAAPLKGRPGRHLRAAAQFLYVGTVEVTRTPLHGAGATLLQAQPAVGAGDFHSLGEIAVESGEGDQVVEIGWTVDHGVNGDDAPHLFAFHWIDTIPQCYNTCGWVQVSTTNRPGMRLVAGESHRYEIKLVGSDWWLYFDGDGLGYFPGSRWGGRFTSANAVQWFGEVAAAGQEPCTQMGNGLPGDDEAAASFVDLTTLDEHDAEAPAAAELGAQNQSTFYRIGAPTPTSFRFGGPGAGKCCVPLTCAQMAAECGRFDEPACGKSVTCGDCGNEASCSEDHLCTGPPTPPDDGGCNAGGSGGSLVLLMLLQRFSRRRREAPSARSSTILAWDRRAACWSWVIATGRSAFRRRPRAR